MDQPDTRVGPVATVAGEDRAALECGLGAPAGECSVCRVDRTRDVRGAGYFYGIELVKDKATKETFDDDESERLLRGFLSKALFDNGLYCRADDRGDPVIQLSPPLIATREELDESLEFTHDAAEPGEAGDTPEAPKD